MATAPSPPILIWTPGGGVSGGPVSNPPVYSQSDITRLVQGQAYVDVVFGSLQTTSDWVLVACEVENTTDLAPLNIWPGIITNRTTAGFRLQLNGLPDTGNYYLHWAVSGINIAPSPATTYYLTGPTSGGLSVAATFTVALPPSTTLAAPVVVTPSDGGGGGTFSPTFVTLSTGSPSQTFTYTPASYGVKTISTTNSGPLTNPAGIAFSCVVTTYTFTGPTSGTTGSPSTNFTVALPVGGAVVGTVTVTPHDGGGGGTFTPSTVGLTTGASSATFTYTPASDGTKTLSVTNNGGLTNPANISYVASTPFSPSSISGLQVWFKPETLAAAYADGASITAWADSGPLGNGYGGLNGPICKLSIINGFAVARFSSASSQWLGGPSLAPTAWTAFVVMKPVSTSGVLGSLGNTVNQSPLGPYLNSDNLNYFSSTFFYSAGTYTAAFHVLTASTAPSYYVDGVSRSTSNIGAIAYTSFNSLGRCNNVYPDGDIAEVLLYDSALGTTDRSNVENYLKTKFGL